MNREEFIRVARQVSTWEKGTIPFRAAFDQLIAEFDRLNEIITNQSSLINNMGKRGATLQAQLDRISEPYHYSRDKAEYPWIRHEGKADGCPICRLKPLSEKLP